MINSHASALISYLWAILWMNRAGWYLRAAGGRFPCRRKPLSSPKRSTNRLNSSLDMRKRNLNSRLPAESRESIVEAYR